MKYVFSIHLDEVCIIEGRKSRPIVAQFRGKTIPLPLFRQFLQRHCPGGKQRDVRVFEILVRGGRGDGGGGGGRGGGTIGSFRFKIATFAKAEAVHHTFLEWLRMRTDHV